MFDLTYDPEAIVIINDSMDWREDKPKALTAGAVSDINRSNNRSIERIADYIRKIDKVRDYLAENVDELEDHAVEIAKLLDIDLDTEVEVTVNITANLTILVPFGKTLDDLSEHDFDVDLTLNDDDFEIENSNISVDSIDY